MSHRPATRGPGLAMMLLFWVLFMGLGGWWATSWLEQRLNPNAHLNQVAEGEPVRLKRGPGGHFVAPGSINGTPVTFLVDTGATRVALPGIWRQDCRCLTLAAPGFTPPMVVPKAP